MRIRRSAIGAGVILAICFLGGCSQQSDINQLNQNQFALRGMIASDRQRIDSLHDQLRRLQDQIAEMKHGGGPEGGHGEISGVLMWSFGLLMCVLCPVAGFVLRARRRPGGGAAIAWLPPLGALIVTFFPYHPY